MAPWKLPPRAKVFEAFTAVADGRVRVTGPGSATVVSSGGDKTYDVEWSEDGRTITANDNASYWQGYLGYPILAVLLARGELRADEDAVAALAGVPWHDLNKRFKRDYDAAVAHVLGELEERGGDPALVEREVDAVLDAAGRARPAARRPRPAPPCLRRLTGSAISQRPAERRPRVRRRRRGRTRRGRAVKAVEKPAPQSCGRLTCPECGLQMQALRLRCPRCLATIPLGCSGNCSECGKTRS